MTKKKKEKAQTAEVVSRDEIVRDQVKELVTEIGGKYATLAEALREVWSNAYHIKYGYASFKSYCEDEVGFNYEKCKKLVFVAEKVKELNVNIEDAEEIGWTKMSMITSVMDGKNKKALIQLAKDKTRPDLAVEVKKLKSGITDEQTERIITLRVSLTEDQSSIIMDAIETAKQTIDTDNFSVALEHIAYEWASSSNSETVVPLKTILDWAGSAYGVTLGVIEKESIEERLNEEEEEQTELASWGKLFDS
jgi:hypothetical protein